MALFYPHDIPTMVDPIQPTKGHFSKAHLQDGSRLIMSFRRHKGSLFQTILDIQDGW
jgi:hypothetical protein